MDDIKLEINDGGTGEFTLRKGGDTLAAMAVDIQGDRLTVHHTEVAKALEGQGIASKLFDTMVAYARQHRLAVIPHCSYVHTRFKKDPAKFKDIWRSATSP